MGTFSLAKDALRFNNMNYYQRPYIGQTPTPVGTPAEPSKTGFENCNKFADPQDPNAYAPGGAYQTCVVRTEAQRLDQPAIWYKFIVPSLLLGGVAGYFISKKKWL